MSGSNGFQSSSYANDRPPSVTGGGDMDVATDPASSSFFLNDYKKWATENMRVHRRTSQGAGELQPAPWNGESRYFFGQKLNLGFVQKPAAKMKKNCFY